MKAPSFRAMKELYIELEDWDINRIKPEYRKTKRALDAARSIWDWNDAKRMGRPIDGMYIITHLQKNFGVHDKNIEKAFPWGYFKNMFDSLTTHEQMYYKLVERAHQQIGGSSIYKESMKIFKNNLENYDLLPINAQHSTGDALGLEDLSLGFYLMLYRSTMGIAYENRVLRTLSKLVASFGWKVIEADYEMEKEDVDIVLVNGARNVFISVKCFGAFSKRAIDSKIAMKKTKPDLYAGVRDLKADRLLIAEYDGNKFDYIQGVEELGEYLSSL